MKKRLVRAVAILCCGVLMFGECHATAVKEAQERRALVEKPLIAGANAAVPISYDEALAIAEKKIAERRLAAANAKKEDKAETGAEDDRLYGYKNIGIADVSTSLNVRETASKTARKVGMMLPDAACEIKGYEGDWAKIKSGDVKGYVMSSYLLVGEKAQERAKLLMSDTVTVEADVLRVRADASTDSRIITRVKNGTRLTVVPASQETVAKSEVLADIADADKVTEESTIAENAVNKADRKESYASVKVGDKKDKTSKREKIEDPLSVDEDIGDDRGSGPGGKPDVVDEVFETADANADALEAAGAVVDDGWVEVDIGGKMGYVSTEYVAFSKELITATAIGKPANDKHAVADIEVSDTTIDPGGGNDPDDGAGSDYEEPDIAGDADNDAVDYGEDDPPPDDILNEDAPADDEEDEDISDGGDEDARDAADAADGDGTDADNDIEEPDDDVVDLDENADAEAVDEGADIAEEEPEAIEEADADKPDKEKDDNAKKSKKSGKKSHNDDNNDEQKEVAPIVEETAPEPVPASSTGGEAASYAMQFLGNPYAWGGSSLTNGADCSGFVMSVYSNYGVSLPHNSAAQSAYGTSVAASEAQPGDLFFYGKGRISHVGIYIGNGQIIHASNKRTGIKISSAYYQNPVAVKRMF